MQSKTALKVSCTWIIGSAIITYQEQQHGYCKNGTSSCKPNTFVEVIDRGGQTRRVVVEVEPYGIDYVNVLSGLEGGEVLKAQVDASKSGRMNVNKRGSNNKNSKNTPSRSSGGFAPPPGF